MPSVRNWRGVGERTRVTLGQRSRGRRYEPSSHAAEAYQLVERRVRRLSSVASRTPYSMKPEARSFSSTACSMVLGIRDVGADEGRITTAVERPAGSRALAAAAHREVWATKGRSTHDKVCRAADSRPRSAMSGERQISNDPAERRRGRRRPRTGNPIQRKFSLFEAIGRFRRRNDEGGVPLHEGSRLKRRLRRLGPAPGGYGGCVARRSAPAGGGANGCSTTSICRSSYWPVMSEVSSAPSTS